MSAPEAMSAEEWKRKRAEIDALLEEYERDAAVAAAWYTAWKERNSGFRCVRRAPEAQEAALPDYAGEGEV